MTRLLTASLSLLLTSPLTSAFAAQHGRRAREVRLPRPAVVESTQGQDNWEGSYEYGEGGGQTAGGAGMIVTHELVVYKHGDSLVADLDADGFQTSRSLRCDAREEGGKLNLYFNGYREGNILSQYKKGQLLLALERTTLRGRPRLLTYWRAYQPALKDLPSGRVYFKKVG
jgi:hypothetical protein